LIHDYQSKIKVRRFLLLLCVLTSSGNRNTRSVEGPGAEALKRSRPAEDSQDEPAVKRSRDVEFNEPSYAAQISPSVPVDERFAISLVFFFFERCLLRILAHLQKAVQ